MVLQLMDQKIKITVPGILAFALLMLYHADLLAAETDTYPYPSRQISIADGLAHNGVTSLLKDKKGYYWIGTYDGLNRYDGSDFLTYRNTSEQNYFISNRVRTLAEDDRGNIWIGTDEGITIFNQKTESFFNLYTNAKQGQLNKGPIIRNLLVDHEQELILASSEQFGVLVFSADLEHIGNYLPPSLANSEDFVIFNMVKFQDASYLLSSSEGLFIFEPSSGEFQKILASAIPEATYILSLPSDQYLVTSSSGAMVIDHLSGDWKLKTRILSTESFNSVAYDERKRLWLGTINRGLRRVDNFQEVIQGGRPKVQTIDEERGFIRTSGIYTSANDGVWVTTFNHGVLRYDMYPSSFHKVSRKANSVERLQTNEVPNIAPFGQNAAYMTAHHGGEIVYDFVKGGFESLPASMPIRIQDEITGVYSNDRGEMWFKLRNNELTVLRPDGTYDTSPVAEGVTIPLGLRLVTMCEDDLGNIWVASTKDFYRFQLNQKREIIAVDKLTDHSFFRENAIYKIRTLYYDALFNFIWVGTDADGLFRVKLEESTALDDIQVDQYLSDPTDQSSLPSNFVTSIIRLPNGELYLGTERGGICKVLNNDAENLKFIRYSERNGLSNNVVKSILYDEDYNLWISTNIGLNRFNTKSQNIRVYKRSDGLPFEDFSYAAAKLADGTMIFSGITGICFFHPDDLRDDEPVPPFQFDKLTVSGKTILPGDTLEGRILLKESLTNTEQIDLQYDENVFSIDVNSLHYGNPENHYIKYQLRPINTQWIEVKSSQKSIYFSGLQPGVYTLHVMVSNSLNEWGNPRALTLVIHPPFWKTPLAYFAYSILLGLLVFGIIFTILRFQKLQHNIELHRLAKDAETRLNGAKLRFFSNISHEIKTPLTLLQGPVEYLCDRFKHDADVVDKLDLIHRQSRKISVLVDQVHDFQRAEANALKMHRSQFNFDQFIQRIYQDYHFITRQGDKKISVQGGESAIYVNADADKLEKVINNLLSNAIKFTNKGDTIRISYEQREQALLIAVADTGTGIPEEDQARVFDRFFQSSYNNSSSIGGSGIGLAFSKRLIEMHYGTIRLESQVNEGSTFYISLPIIDQDYSTTQDQQVQESELLRHEMEAEDLQKELKLDATPVDFTSNFDKAVLFVVEDNLEMQQYLSSFLGQLFTVKCFNDGKECLEALEDEWPDLVLSDVMMPNINGFELTNQIKSNIKTSHIPVLLLTASQTEHDKLKGYEGGADAYVHKPFEKTHLLVRIEALLNSRYQIRKRFEIDLPLTITKEESNDHAFVDKLYSLIDKNLDNQDLDLNSFSKELYLNRTHFYQKVKALTGQTPYELLKNYRLKKAAQMLYQEQYTVSEVFMMTGFKSRTHFAKIFKDKYEVSPGKYAEKMNETIG